jgi:hypothetical protein
MPDWLAVRARLDSRLVDELLHFSGHIIHHDCAIVEANGQQVPVLGVEINREDAGVGGEGALRVCGVGE